MCQRACGCGIEARRASATVLIGHPALHPDIPEEQLNDVLRTLNTHVNRVEALTYKALVDNAERALGGGPTDFDSTISPPNLRMDQAFADLSDDQ